MYSSLLVGKFMEPETHLFFARLIPQVPIPLRFVDVGAAIGEMIMDVAGYPNVVEVIGFDPDPDNVEACRRSAQANGFAHVTMIEKIVADEIREVDFRMNRRRGTSGQILDCGDGTTQRLPCTTLDHEIPNATGLYLLLVDVEGAEPLVLKGATRFIASTRPLIIFEYITGRDRGLVEIGASLGPQYEIFRLRSDGFLDRDMSRTWNCVAVHRDSPFQAICNTILHQPSTPAAAPASIAVRKRR
jgi:FkbM family methyltransferase